MNNRLNIIIVDDEIGIIDTLKANLSDHNVTGVLNSKEAINIIKKERFDLLILDYYVDDLTGEDIVKKIREFDNDLYILILTGYADSVPGISTLDNLDIQNYVEKTDIKQVKINIKSAVKSVMFMKSNREKKGETFAIRLKQLRKNFNVSQEELGNYLSIGRTTIANYESGFNMPSVEMLEKIATFFGVSTDYLLCREVNFPDVYKKYK
ncbi:UNVERIFIED_CONTAM: DNA-binding XRE family transcriptional regulator [Acetivibrio alkalicellulosi]